MEVAREVGRRQRLLFWKVTGIYLAASAVIWLLFYAVTMGKDEFTLGMAAAWVILLFFFLTLLTFFCMLPSFFKGKYR